MDLWWHYMEGEFTLITFNEGEKLSHGMELQG